MQKPFSFVVWSEIHQPVVLQEVPNSGSREREASSTMRMETLLRLRCFFFLTAAHEWAAENIWQRRETIEIERAASRWLSFSALPPLRLYERPQWSQRAFQRAPVPARRPTEIDFAHLRPALTPPLRCCFIDDLRSRNIPTPS